MFRGFTSYILCAQCKKIGLEKLATLFWTVSEAQQIPESTKLRIEVCFLKCF